MAEVETRSISSGNLHVDPDVEVGIEDSSSSTVPHHESVVGAAVGGSSGTSQNVFLKLRRKNTIASILLFAPIALYFGSSVMVPFMNKASANPWVAPGVTQPALMNVVANMIIMPCIGNSMSKLGPLNFWLAAVTSIANPILIGVSADFNILWLQYIGAIVGALGFATALQSGALLMQWWSVDGRAAMGSALFGGFTGLLTAALSIVSALTFSAFGFARGMHIIAAIMLALYVYPLWLALRGEFGSMASVLPDATSIVMAKSVAQKPLVTQGSANLYTSCAFWQMFFHTACYPFVGFGMKALTTTIFAAAYKMSYLESACMFVLSLSLHLVVRSVLPFSTSGSRGAPVTSLSAALMAFSSLLYALYPAIIASSSAWVFLFAKTLTSAAFAGLFTLSTLLLLRVWGPSHLPRMFSALGFARGIGFGLGPVVGHYLQTLETLNGKQARFSFNLFFYVCAAVAALDAVNLAWLSVNHSVTKPTDALESNSKEKTCSPEVAHECSTSP